MIVSIIHSQGLSIGAANAMFLLLVKYNTLHFVNLHKLTYVSGHGHTEGIIQSFNDVFTHSTCEKAEFVRDFLISLGVKKLAQSALLFICILFVVLHGCVCIYIYVTKL